VSQTVSVSTERTHLDRNNEKVDTGYARHWQKYGHMRYFDACKTLAHVTCERIHYTGACNCPNFHRQLLLVLLILYFACIRMTYTSILINNNIIGVFTCFSTILFQSRIAFLFLSLIRLFISKMTKLMQHHYNRPRVLLRHYGHASLKATHSSLKLHLIASRRHRCLLVY